MKKGVNLDFEKGDGLPAVMADKVHLSRAFANIMSNAVKFTPAGYGITVRTAASGGGAAISVTDTGGGIPEEERECIFDKYRRSKNSQKMDGMGLGLFITKTIAESHGGRLTLDSVLGKGSTFTIHLPLAEGRNADG